MAQWVNCLRNNIFVNPPPLPLLCEISGALHLAQPIRRNATVYNYSSPIHPGHYSRSLIIVMDQKSALKNQ